MKEGNTPSPSRVAELIEAVEKAPGANYALDCAIFETLALPTEWFGSKVVGHFKVGGKYGFNTEDGFRHMDCLRPPTYTSSLDSALSLVERVLPGWGWTVTAALGGGFTATVFDATGKVFDPNGDANISLGEWIEQGRYHRPTPALAICLALLKAVEAGKVEGRE